MLPETTDFVTDRVMYFYREDEHESGRGEGKAAEGAEDADGGPGGEGKPQRAQTPNLFSALPAFSAAFLLLPMMRIAPYRGSQPAAAV